MNGIPLYKASFLIVVMQLLLTGCIIFDSQTAKTIITPIELGIATGNIQDPSFDTPYLLNGTRLEAAYYETTEEHRGSRMSLVASTGNYQVQGCLVEEGCYQASPIDAGHYHDLGIYPWGIQFRPGNEFSGGFFPFYIIFAAWLPSLSLDFGLRTLHQEASQKGLKARLDDGNISVNSLDYAAITEAKEMLLNNPRDYLGPSGRMSFQWRYKHFSINADLDFDVFLYLDNGMLKGAPSQQSSLSLGYHIIN